MGGGKRRKKRPKGKEGTSKDRNLREGEAPPGRTAKEKKKEISKKKSLIQLLWLGNEKSHKKNRNTKRSTSRGGFTLNFQANQDPNAKGGREAGPAKQ